MLVLLASGLITTMAPVKEANYPGHWVTPDDYPASAIRKGELGYYEFAVTVSPTGEPERCEITNPGGYADLRDLTCRLVMKRAKFNPATGVDGSPTTGVYKSDVGWFQGEDRIAIEQYQKRFPAPSGTDIYVTVNKLPDGLTSPAKIYVDVAIDATGAIQTCAPEPGMSSVLGPITCQQLKGWTPYKTVDKDGLPIASIQRVRVDFTVAATSPAQ